MSLKSLLQKGKEKVKNAGFTGLIHAVINHIYFNFYKLFPIKKNYIAIESQDDLSDNSYALYDYMRRHGYLTKYHVVWFVDDVASCSKNKWLNTDFVSKFFNKDVDRKRAKALATCKWIIYDHCNIIGNLKKRPDQKVVYLSHGCGYKDAKGADITKEVTRPDMITVTGPLAADYMSKFWSMPIEKNKITGYPRLDYFFEDNTVIRKKINDKWHFAKYKKIVFWMPTFRQSVAKEISEEYIQNQTGLPIFETYEDLKKFSDYLRSKNTLLVFKLHHLQAGLPVFQKHFSNILIVHDEDLANMGIQLYQFVTLADVLITDYSSISVDYLLLNRPIIFTLDDYEQYEKSRGLYPKNAIDYMKGYHVFNQKELEESLTEIISGIDKYADDRKNIMKDYHTYTDGNSSKRVLDTIGITFESVKN